MTAQNDDFLTRPRPWAKPPDGECPVSEQQRVWIERSMLWLADEFGREAARGELAVPLPDFYPGYRPEPEAIEALVRRVEGVMGIEPDRIIVELFDSEMEPLRQIRRSERGKSTTVGGYWREDGREHIALDLNKAQDPEILAAVIAHELAHARLIGEDRYPSAGPRGEELTDLATVFLGMGVFSANASINFDKTVRGWSAEPLGDVSERQLLGQGDFNYHQLGYLEEPDFGYALACLCGLRREPDPWWAEFLDPPLRVVLRRSLAYFRKIAQRG